MFELLVHVLNREKTHDYASCVLAMLVYATMCYLLVSSKVLPEGFMSIVGVITGYYFRVVTSTSVPIHTHGSTSTTQEAETTAESA
jgi:uncharacterized membrane protein (UPF0136 family)